MLKRKEHVIIYIRIIAQKIMKKVLFEKVIKIDVIFYIVLSIMSVVGFLYYYDLPITVWQSNELINIIGKGKIFDFYQLVYDKAASGGFMGNGLLDSANYNILIYSIIAIWILPIRCLNKLFHIGWLNNSFVYVMWTKVLILLCNYLLGYIMLLLAKSVGYDLQKGRKLAYYTVATSLLLFGSLMFGQVDIIALVVIMLSYCAYIKGDIWKFTILSSVAMCLKGFDILIFIPLLLLVEKKIFNLLKYCVSLFVFPLLTRILFNNGYAATKEFMNETYNFKARIWNAQIAGGLNNISIFCFIMILICVGCYLCESKGNKLLVSSGIVVAIFTNFFSTISFHPQWIILMSPFLAIIIVESDFKKILQILFIFLDFSYIISVCAHYCGAVDNNMIANGLFAKVIPGNVQGNIADIFGKLGIPEVFFYTIFVASLVSICGIWCMTLKRKSCDSEIQNEYRGLVYLRLSISLCFIIVSICLFL